MTAADVSALVDEHYGAMHRLARLVGGDEARARVRRPRGVARRTRAPRTLRAGGTRAGSRLSSGPWIGAAVHVGAEGVDRGDLVGALSARSNERDILA